MCTDPHLRVCLILTNVERLVTGRLEVRHHAVAPRFAPGIFLLACKRRSVPFTGPETELIDFFLAASRDFL